MKRDQIRHRAFSSPTDGYIGLNLNPRAPVPKLAELYGAKGLAVTRKEELKPVFQQALASDDFVVVDVKLD